MHVSFFLSLLIYASASLGSHINTTSGTIIGHSSSRESKVEEFLGIPYAKPPLGDLRFAAPEAYDGQGKEFEAKEFSPSCPFIPQAKPQDGDIPGWIFTPQARTFINKGLLTTDNVSSEDCLTMNLWVPPSASNVSTNTTSSSTLKPVLLWLYPGGFSTGSSSIFDGAHLALEQDVIVTSLNYRVSIFGFPGISSSSMRSSTSLNAGLLDQRLGLEWLRDNALAFGGDPARITLLGQSAGGASVDYHTFAWPDEPIAHAAIAQSGSALMSPALTPANAALNWHNISAALNCSSPTTPTIAVDPAELSCMRALPASALSAAIAHLPASLAPGDAVLSPFYPTADNATVFADYPARLRAGRVARLPMIVGSTEHESGLLTAIAALSVGAAGVDYIGSAARWRAFEAVMFGCAAGLRAGLALQEQGEEQREVYRYWYAGDWANVRVVEDAADAAPRHNMSRRGSGAYHGTEVTLLFGSYNGLPPPEEEELRFAKELRGLWAAFARDPVSFGERWRRYQGKGSETLRVLAEGNRAGERYVDPEEKDWKCAFLDAVFGEEGVTKGFDEVGEEVYQRFAELEKEKAREWLGLYGV